jgi:hypothetical protein
MQTKKSEIHIKSIASIGYKEKETSVHKHSHSKTKLNKLNSNASDLLIKTPLLDNSTMG